MEPPSGPPPPSEPPPPSSLATPSSGDTMQPDRGSRPGSVTLSAVVLMVFGVILSLFGLVFTLFGVLFDTLRAEPELVDQLGPLPEGAGVGILIFGVVILTWGVLDVVAAAFVLGRRGWARITAIVLAILGTLAGVALALQAQSGVNLVRVAFLLAFTGGHAFAIWALSRSGAWFAGR